MLQRFKGAAFGLGITLVPIAALACVHFLLVPYTAATVYNVDQETEARLVSNLRQGIVRAYPVIALIIAAYWLLAAALGRGEVLRIRSANIVLALSILTFAVTVVILSTVPKADRIFKGACPLLGYPDELPALSSGDMFAFVDGPTPCDSFASAAGIVVFIGMPLILFATSAILRIVGSRRR